jgi:hypothetical protein
VLTGLRIVSARGDYADLAWDRPEEGVVTVYRVYRGIGPEFELGPETLAATTREEACLLAGLKPSTDYWFRVTAENATGLSSQPTDTLHLRTGALSLARGRSYAKSIEPSPSYPDRGDAQSTDGNLAGDYGDGRSYGYRLREVGDTITLRITVDLGEVRSIGRAAHHACGAPGYRPDRLIIHASADGVDWRACGEARRHRGDWLTVDFQEIEARHVRFQLEKERHHGTDDWLFIDELEVF